MKRLSQISLSCLLALTACGPQDGQNSNELQLNKKSTSGIVGGVAAKMEDSLSVVRIIDGFGRTCTGTLIAKDVVLTAAHCVRGGGEHEIYFAADDYYMIPSSETVAHENYKVVQDFNDKMMKNDHRDDIGLILLSEPAPPKAVIAELPSAAVTSGKLTLKAIGYGRTGAENEDSGVLRSVDLDALVKPGDNRHFFVDQTVGKGMCMGDSGGPLFTFKDSQPVVMGIVNGADQVRMVHGRIMGDQCRYTGVAAQVGAHLEWIKKHMDRWTQTTPVSVFEPGVDVSQAFCRKPMPSLKTMEAELLEMTAAEPTKNSGVGGLAIKNEHPRLVEAYRYLTTYKTYQFKIDTEIDYWNIFKDVKCDKALCGAKTIFGEEMGILNLYVAAKYGLVLSHLGFDRLKRPAEADPKEFAAYFGTRAWTKEELVPYLRALPMLPTMGIPLPYTRFNHAGAVNAHNPNVLVNGIIQFYSTMDSHSDSEKEQTAYHEIGHNFGSKYGLDSSPEWLEASGWGIENGKFVNKGAEKFVTEYASKDFFEDFAESFTYYRYYPAKLKERSPSRYEYFKKTLFQGKEFLSEASCQ